MNSPLATVREAGAFLNVTKPTIYKLINEGEIESLKVGRKRLVVLASIDRYIKRGIAQAKG